MALETPHPELGFCPLKPGEIQDATLTRPPWRPQLVGCPLLACPHCAGPQPVRSTDPQGLPPPSRPHGVPVPFQNALPTPLFTLDSSTQVCSLNTPEHLLFAPPWLWAQGGQSWAPGQTVMTVTCAEPSGVVGQHGLPEGWPRAEPTGGLGAGPGAVGRHCRALKASGLEGAEGSEE